MENKPSGYLKDRFKETVEKMIETGAEKQGVSGEQFFVTTNPNNEPDGTLFLAGLKRDGKHYVLCTKR